MFRLPNTTKMMVRFAFLLLITLCSFQPVAAAPTSMSYNIRDFGAKGNGTNIDSDAINAAIEASSKAGGGTIYFPAGTYLSYSIRLKSHIALYLDQGCVLLAADSAAGGRYDEPDAGPGNKFQDYGHSHWHNSLIWGENLDDVSILGPGIIYGKGLSRGFYRSENWEKEAYVQAPICEMAVPIKRSP